MLQEHKMELGFNKEHNLVFWNCFKCNPDVQRFIDSRLIKFEVKKIRMLNTILEEQNKTLDVIDRTLKDEKLNKLGVNDE